MFEKYLVTGAASPVGRLVVNMLVESGSSVRVLLADGVDASAFENAGVEVCRGEIFDKDSMKDFFTVDDARHSVVIHTEEVVSISSQPNLNMRRINVSGSQNVIDQCLKYKIGRVVWLGSAYALNPESGAENSVLHFDRTKVEGDYAKTKAEAGAYIIEKISLNKLNAVILLPTFIIGPGFDDDYEMNKILKRFIDSGVPTIKGGHAFVDIRDVASALVSLVENGQVGGCYILNGEYKSSDDFFRAVTEASGMDSQFKKAPKWVMSKTLAKFVDTYYRISKKENPKEVYALFRNNPETQFSTTVHEMLPDGQVIGVHDSLNYVINGIETYSRMEEAKPDVPSQEAETAPETEETVSAAAETAAVAEAVPEAAWEAVPEVMPEEIPEAAEEFIPVLAPEETAEETAE